MASITPKLDLIRTLDALKTNPLTRQPIGRGQHIYAYCNIRTNQVIYSLTQILSPYRNLRQLPDAGNNTKPPKLRKDQWRPLWTLTLPSGFQGEAQGLAAWQRLNALRYMHELYWTPPKELARNHTEKELEEIQDRIDDRGGSKKENVYDVIKRQKKKLRLKNVMDQKANSVADLAAVLGEHEEIAARGAGEYGRHETDSVLRLAERLKEGDLEKLEAEIEKLGRRVREVEKETPGLKDNEVGRSVAALKELRYSARRKLRDAVSKKEGLEHALFMASMASPKPIKPEPAKESEDVEESGEAQNETQQDLDEEHPPEPKPEREFEASNWEKFKSLRRTPTHSYDQKTRKPSPHPFAEVLRRAREVLLPEGLADTPENIVQVRRSGINELGSMIQSNRLRAAELRAHVESHRETASPPESTTSERTEWAQLSLEINLWTDMIRAYEATGGTLQITHPKTREVGNLGADFIDNSPEARTQNLLYEAERSKLEKKGSAVRRREARERRALAEREARERNALAKREAIAARKALAKEEAPAEQEACADPNAVAEQEPARERKALVKREAIAARKALAKQEALSKQEAVTEPIPTPKPKKVSKRLRPNPTIVIPNPAFSMQGVKVSWQNVLDAEFASAWPESVQHDWMGITRHTAPKPGVEPSLTAQEYYASRKRVRVDGEVEGKSVRGAVREDVVKSVSSAILRELIGRPRDVSRKDGGEKVAFLPAVEKESLVEAS